jgi:hypothetical protein
MPLGMFSLIGMCDVCLLMHCTVADKKICVHPESSIAVSSAVAVKIIWVQSKVNAN